jgi:hypothetical protein
VDTTKLLIKRVNAPHEHKKKWNDEKRIDVVTKYLALGNLRLVSEITGVNYGMIRNWKMQPWWADIVAEIKASRNLAVDSKLSKIVDKSLEMIEDRLENGDMVYNRKTGEVERRPVSLELINKVSKTAMEQQAAITTKESAETQTQMAQTINDQIRFLAEEFAKFNTRRTIPAPQEIEDAVYVQRKARLQEATEVRLQAGEHPEEERGQQGSSDNGESWASAQGGWEGRGPHQAAEQGWEDDEEQSEGSISSHQSFIRPDIEG